MSYRSTNKCKDCKGCGYAGKGRLRICPTCRGSGKPPKPVRGHHSGDNGEKIGIGTKEYCARGHLKTGTGVDNDGNLRTYCTICHSEVTSRTEKRKRERVT